MGCMDFKYFYICTNCKSKAKNVTETDANADEPLMIFNRQNLDKKTNRQRSGDQQTGYHR